MKKTKLRKRILLLTLIPLLIIAIGIGCLWIYSSTYTIPEQAASIENTTGLVQAHGRSLYTADGKAIQVRQDLVSVSQVSEIPYPCLITVDKDMCVPRLPSYRLKKATEGRPVRFLSFNDLPDRDLTRYGLVGSPTAVERMFAPPEKEKQVYIQGSAREKTDEIFRILTGKKII